MDTNLEINEQSIKDIIKLKISKSLKSRPNVSFATGKPGWS